MRLRERESSERKTRETERESRERARERDDASNDKREQSDEESRAQGRGKRRELANASLCVCLRSSTKVQILTPVVLHVRLRKLGERAARTRWRAFTCFTGTNTDS